MRGWSVGAIALVVHAWVQAVVSLGVWADWTALAVCAAQLVLAVLGSLAAPARPDEPPIPRWFEVVAAPLSAVLLTMPMLPVLVER